MIDRLTDCEASELGIADGYAIELTQDMIATRESSIRRSDGRRIELIAQPR